MIINHQTILYFNDINTIHEFLFNSNWLWFCISLKAVFEALSTFPYFYPQTDSHLALAVSRKEGVWILPQCRFLNIIEAIRFVICNMYMRINVYTVYNIPSIRLLLMSNNASFSHFKIDSGRVLNWLRLRFIPRRFENSPMFSGNSCNIFPSRFNTTINLSLSSANTQYTMYL
jgi:hypothetical protein